MKEILEPIDMLGDYSGAGSGSWLECSGKELASVSPVHGQVIGKIQSATRANYERIVAD